MSTENTPVESDDVDLDDFAAELFGQKKAEPEPTNSEDVKDESEDVDAAIEDDTLATDETVEEDADKVVEDEVKDTTKPKKNSLQERIDQAVGRQREAERREDAVKAQLAEALQRLEKLEHKADTPKPSPKATKGGPQPTDQNDDGSEKYPLGEFDPQYLEDIVSHKFEQELKAFQDKQRELETARAKEESEAALKESWNKKLEPAKQKYPDFVEKGEQIAAAFEGVDDSYGEYLATTIMSMEYGPDVFYYLANNLDEARKIVQSGAQRATVALGRLEAKFALAEEEKQKARPKVSQAPEPPPQNKGSAAAKPAIRGDEDDINLDDFANALFKKRRS